MSDGNTFDEFDFTRKEPREVSNLAPLRTPSTALPAPACDICACFLASNEKTRCFQCRISRAQARLQEGIAPPLSLDLIAKAGVKQGREEATAKIVAWLRARADIASDSESDAQDLDGASALREAAGLIEQNDAKSLLVDEPATPPKTPAP